MAAYAYRDKLPDADDVKLHELMNARLARVRQVRAEWEGHWAELAEFIQPTRLRLGTGVSRGAKKRQSIVDATGSLAFRTLASGMMSGITSPSRIWFRFITRDPKLAEFAAVKEWLHAVEQRTMQILQASNLYNVLHAIYGDIGVFGTAAAMIVDDFQTVIRGQSLPLGTFWLAAGHRGEVDTLYREIPMTVGQVVAEFGYHAACQMTRQAWDLGHYHHPVTVWQCIEPNRAREPERADAAGKPWRSVYWEKGSEAGRFLAVRGYDRKPFVAPRWDVTGNDPYGTSCPGMDALPDIKGLQHMQRQKAIAVEKMTTPATQGPATTGGRQISHIPGKHNVVDDIDLQRGGIRPLYELNIRVAELTADIRETQMRIREAAYADLFLMMAQSDRRQITAEEIIERRAEKMIGLGPVLERLQDELVRPLLDIAFDRIMDAGIVGPPPKELQGEDLGIELISMLAREQRGDEIAAVDRILGVAGNIAGLYPDVLDKVDFDQAVDEYGRLLGGPPTVIRPDDEVARIRADRARRQQAADGMAMLAEGAAAAKTLSEVDTSAESVLGRLMTQQQAAPT